MKLFGRKKNRQETAESASTSSDAGSSFYAAQNHEAPLDEIPQGHGRQIHRTSQHTPARRRDNSNRATNHDMLLLLFRMVLIPALIIGAFFGLKAVLGLFDGPTEKDRVQWETNTELMEKGTDVLTAGATSESTEQLSIDLDFLRERLSRWEQTERHLRGAEALPRLGIYEDAIVRLEKALRLSPNNQKAQQMLLEIYMKTGNYAGAIPLCVRMLDQDSTRWDIKVDLLKALQGVEETAMCVFLSDQMLLQQPGDAGVLEISAYAHAAEGDTENALRMYEQVLANDPKHLLALEGSGVIYQWQKKWLKAVPYYLELLELDPKPEHYLALARGYAQQAEAGKTVIFLGQAANLYGAETVSPWLALPEFDPVRETADFRSFVDRMVGTGTRNAIEEIRRLEAQRTPLLEVDQIMLPSKPDLEILKPRR
ncbi:MAG: tetratricopeptide repeat protein [Kiritimatiellales bacterium]|nr:tetratricopeptide repeat protein [Kiritimatiellota bacterium]MBL7011719.1 tetratricopeptide repeat protein [Kiritimatiellales bacterium]